MKSHAMDDILEAESDLRHLETLVNVITEMTIDSVGNLSPGASSSDRSMISTLSDMLWIARDLCGRVCKDLEDATGRMLVERKAQRQKGEVQS